jgi:hypothetical protein
MTKFWSRYQSQLAFSWGVVGLENREKVRPAFKAQGDSNNIDSKNIDSNNIDSNNIGSNNKDSNNIDCCQRLIFGGVKKVTSYLDRNSSDYIVASQANKYMRIILSVTACLSLGAVIIFCTFQVYSLQHLLESDTTISFLGIYLSPYSQYITTALNVMQTLFFQPITRYVNYILTEFENHRTQTEFHDAVIAKSSMFAFITSFVSFFYIAFIAGNQIVVLFGYSEVETCAGYETCMEALSYNLVATVFAGFVKHLITEFSPIKRLNAILNANYLVDSDASKKLRDEQNHLAIFAAQYFKFDSLGADAKWDAMLAYNYTAFFTEFGLMLFFLSVYPFVILLVFFSQWIEVLGDMRVVVKALRTLPVAAEDIGSYEV